MRSPRAARLASNIDIADENVDDFASRLSKAALTITRDDRSHPLYAHFFGKKPISTFLRPKLGVQLDSMRNWGESLATSQFPALQTMAAELGALVVAADKALSARSETQNQLRKFPLPLSRSRERGTEGMRDEG